MDVEERIERRRRNDDGTRLVVDYEALAPVTHVSEPVGRGPVLEQLLDQFDPVFHGTLPGTAYVWGPSGSGKSAVLTALVEHLRDVPREAESIIHTSTRATDPAAPTFVRVDARSANTEFGIYHAMLDAVVDETVPKHGVGTDSVCDRLGDALADRPAVVVVDHVDEPATLDRTTLLDLVEPFADSVAWVGVGRAPPTENGWAADADACVEVPPYESEVLVDVLTARATAGLARRAVDHGGVREVARWADGDAHDALAALFVAADAAATAGRERVTPDDLEAGMADVPRDGVPIGRLLALPANRQAVLRELVGLDGDERSSVTATTEAIGGAPAIDLSAATVERFLYELADAGILIREENDDASVQGRPPSRVEPGFSSKTFRLLYDPRAN